MKRKIFFYGALSVLPLFVYVITYPATKDARLTELVEDTSEVPQKTGDMSSGRITSKRAESEDLADRDLAPRPFNQLEADLRNDPNDPKSRSEFARQLDNPDLTESASIGALANLLLTYRQLGNGGYYDSAENIEVTNALLGDNPRKVAFISAENSRINSEGELVDGFGVPYDFHFISSKSLIIRSAGVDQEFYTDDDVVSASEEELADGTAILGSQNLSVEP